MEGCHRGLDQAAQPLLGADKLGNHCPYPHSAMATFRPANTNGTANSRRINFGSRVARQDRVSSGGVASSPATDGTTSTQGRARLRKPA